MSDLQSYETSRGHLRALWNLYTHLIVTKDPEAATVRAAITIAEREELDAVGKF